MLKIGLLLPKNNGFGKLPNIGGATEKNPLLFGLYIREKKLTHLDMHL